MNKVENICDHSMILWEMKGDLLTNWWIPAPSSPGFLGLSHLHIYFDMELSKDQEKLNHTVVLPGRILKKWGLSNFAIQTF